MYSLIMWISMGLIENSQNNEMRLNKRALDNSIVESFQVSYAIPAQVTF